MDTFDFQESRLKDMTQILYNICEKSTLFEFNCHTPITKCVLNLVKVSNLLFHRVGVVYHIIPVDDRRIPLSLGKYEVQGSL